MAKQRINPQQIKPQEAWIDVTFQNSWVNFGAPYANVQYMKDFLGFVHMRGIMKSGSMNNIAFTFPAGYRPGAKAYVPTASNGTIGIFNLTTAGELTPDVGSNGSFSFDGVTFKAEN